MAANEEESGSNAVEEQEIDERCGIRVEIISADNVWLLEPGEAEKSQAAVSIKFPSRFPDKDEVQFESESFPPFIPPPPEPTPEELAAQQAAAAAAAEAKGKDDKKKKGQAEDTGPPIVGNYPMGFCKVFRRKSDWPFCHTLITEPMVVTLQWIAPGGAMKVPAGVCNFDLGPLLRLTNEDRVEFVGAVEVPQEEDPAAAAGGGKGKAAPPKKEAPKGGKKGGPETPPLLEGATVKVVFSTSEPLLCDVDRVESVDFEIKQFTVKSPPANLVEFKEKSTDDPFLYNIKFEFPGFRGSWWDSITDMPQDEKLQLADGLASGGVVDIAAEQPAAKSVSAETEPAQVPSGAVVQPEAGAAGETQPAKTKPLLAWKTTYKRFLPSDATIELKKLTRRGNRCYGELARFVKDGRADIIDPCFKNYHCGFWIDLSPLVEDGVTEATLCCALGDCRGEGKHLLSQVDRVVDLKKAVPVEQPDPNAPDKNCWKDCQSVLFIHVKTSQPLEPIWTPPPEPEMTLCDVVPPRPKLQTVYNATQMAMQDFNDFVRVAAKAISTCHMKVVSEKETRSCASSLARVDHMEEMRKRLSQELHKLGAWQDIKQKMRTKVFKIATEKFKFRKEDAVSGGKFEFCNALYVQLMDEIQMCLRDVFAEKRRMDRDFPETIYTLESLKQLADEYEVDWNWRSADKFHLDRLVGEGMKCANTWFDYGAYWMRCKTVDHGRAEECFRESISLYRDHLPSLVALACLFWHRGFDGRAEALVRGAIELHPEEEFILWAILSRVHAARSERSSSLSCRRKCEVVFNELIAMSENTPLLSMDSALFPFSPTSFILRSSLSNSPFVQAALLLLDLKLPAEARELLMMEDDVFSCTVEFKLGMAMVAEQQGDAAESERMFKEALNLEYEDGKTWCYLAHARYARGQFDEALQAYTKTRQFWKCNEIYQYAYIELGNIYLIRGEFAEARQTFLRGARVFPCSSMWLGVGIAYYRLGDMVTAERALVEGNLLDSQNFKIWAYLTLACISTSRMDEAEFAFHQSLKNIKDAKLLVEVGIAFASKRNFRFAEIAFTESLKEENNLNARFLLGDVLYQQGKSNALCC